MPDAVFIESESRKEVVVPKHWTVLYHGSNLGREEWQGDKKDILDDKELEINTRYPGLSCIDQEEKDREKDESSRMSFNYDTTRGFSFARPGIEDKPLELRIVMPYVHDRTSKKADALAHFRGILPEEGIQAMLELTNKVYWKLNNQHPVIPNATNLIKIGDSSDSNGKRVVWYTPKLTLNVYYREAQTK